MKTYYIEQPADPDRSNALATLLAGLEEFYLIECRDVVAITTDLPSLDGLLGGIERQIARHGAIGGHRL
jgi:hypothetical protein